MIERLIASLADILSWGKYRWAHLMGFTSLVLVILFSLMVVWYSPRETTSLMRHAGIFVAHLGVVGVVLGAWFCLYVLFYVHIDKVVHRPYLLRAVIVWTVIIGLVLTITPPFFSSDVYGYVSRSIIANIHQVNPHIVTPGELGYEGVVSWPQQVLVYGPLFTSYAVGLAKLVGASVVANIFVFRVLNLLLFLGAAWLMHRILGEIAPRWQSAGVVLFVTNPFFLIEIIHSGHNDIFILVSILLAIWLVIGKKFIGSFLALTAGFLIKFSTAVLYPLIALLTLRQPMRRAWREISLSIILCTAFIIGTYAPWHVFDRNIGNLGRAFITDNFLTFPQAIIQSILIFASRVFDSFTIDVMVIRASYLLVFLVLFGFLVFWPGLHRGESMIKRMAWLLLAFLFLLGGKFNIWYIIWFAPLVLIVGDRRYHPLILLMTGYGFMYYVSLNVFFPNVIFCVVLAGYWIGSTIKHRSGLPLTKPPLLNTL